MEEKLDIWWLNEESEQMLNRGYLLKGETVEGAIDRITTAAAKRLYKPELIPAFKEMITKGWISFSSPVWANMGTQRGLPISCFNVCPNWRRKRNPTFGNHFLKRRNEFWFVQAFCCRCSNSVNSSFYGFSLQKVTSV
jgi:hypothetical protein